jgi:hypothetical protein
MILTSKGHTAIARALIEQDYYLAWGGLAVGQQPWETHPDAVDVSATTMYREVGRQKVTLKKYAYLDPNGSIVVDDKQWSLTDEPTPNIYVQFKFDANAASNEVLYQLGVWVDTLPNKDLPELSFKVNNEGGYAIGDTRVRINDIKGGELADFLPVPLPNADTGGRQIVVGSSVIRVLGVDALNSTLIVSALPVALKGGQALTVSKVTATEPGRFYLSPGHILDAGMLLMLDNIPPIYRDAATRNMFEYVLQF